MISMHKYLKTLRSERHLTQEQLAKKLDVTEPTILAMENKSKYLSPNLAVKLANLYKLPLIVMLYYTKPFGDIDINSLSYKILTIMFNKQMGYNPKTFPSAIKYCLRKTKASDIVSDKDLTKIANYLGVKKSIFKSFKKLHNKKPRVIRKSQKEIKKEQNTRIRRIHRNLKKLNYRVCHRKNTCTDYGLIKQLITAYMTDSKGLAKYLKISATKIYNIAHLKAPLDSFTFEEVGHMITYAHLVPYVAFRQMLGFNNMQKGSFAYLVFWALYKKHIPFKDFYHKFGVNVLIFGKSSKSKVTKDILERVSKFIHEPTSYFKSSEICSQKTYDFINNHQGMSRTSHKEYERYYGSTLAY